MTPPDEQLDADLAALLQRGAPRPTLPDDVSARLLRRAAASTVVTTGLLASMSASAKVALASVAVVVAAGGVWTATRAPAAPATSAVATAPAVVAVPAIPTPAEAPAPVEEPVVETAEAPAVPPAPAAPTKRVAVVDEVTLLERARIAIGDGRLAEAEVALLQHRRQHPRGSLSEEREALMVVTIARRGDKVRAHQGAAAFHRRFEHSAFAAVVDAAVQ
jgi:TolA-binding protein